LVDQDKSTMDQLIEQFHKTIDGNQIRDFKLNF
jgi:hypothetical protein